MPAYKPSTLGFTLLELAIVIVVIGLVAGGIIVGRDLISAAAVRAQLSQLDVVQTGIGVFRQKYSCLPGDCAKAGTYGFVARQPNIRGRGDGNGVLEGLGSTCNSWWYAWADQTPQEVRPFSQVVGENAVFWRDMSEAGLIPEKVSLPTNDNSDCTAWACMDPTPSTSPSIFSFYPRAKYGKTGLLYVYSDGGVNYIGLSEARIMRCFYLYTNPLLSTAEAFIMDTKVDDGLPLTGSVLAQYVTNTEFAIAHYSFKAGVYWAGYTDLFDDPYDAASASATSCFDNNNVDGDEPRYSVGYNQGNSRNCALSFRFKH